MHILFDLDGTLTDPAPGIVACLEHALREMGAPSTDPHLSRFIGPPLQETFAQLLATSDPGVIEAAIGHYRERFADVGLFENALYPAIPLALQELSDRGFALRVATSKPHVFADRIIDHFGLRDFFPRVYGSELSGVRTDKGELIEYVLRTESLSPASTIMVGDRRHDIDGARVNRVPAVGVLWGFGSHEELMRAAPDAIVETAEELVETLLAVASGQNS